jgi:hypothetical protein
MPQCGALRQSFGEIVDHLDFVESFTGIVYGDPPGKKISRGFIRLFPAPG